MYNETQNISSHTEKAIKSVINSKYTRFSSTKKAYVDRNEVRVKVKQKLTTAITEAFANQHHDSEHKTVSTFLRTAVVCGPRGCGKSTIVAEIFRDQKAVVPVVCERDMCRRISRSLQMMFFDLCHYLVLQT